MPPLVNPRCPRGARTSVLRSKTLPQAEFTSAEEYKSIGVPGLPSGKLGIGFAVVNVGDDGKVADMGLIVHTL